MGRRKNGSRPDSICAGLTCSLPNADRNWSWGRIDLLSAVRVINHGGYPHRLLAGSHSPAGPHAKLANQAPGGGMGMRGGAVCPIKAISAAPNSGARELFCILHSAFRLLLAMRMRAEAMVWVYSSRKP